MNKPLLNALLLVQVNPMVVTLVNRLYHNDIDNKVLHTLVLQVGRQLNVDSFIQTCKSRLNDTIHNLVFVKQYE